MNVISDLENFFVSNVRIVMINSNFSFGSNISQERLKNIMNNDKYSTENPENVWRIASFQPEKYTGLNSKYLTSDFRHSNTLTELPKKIDEQVSILVFRSGKVTITGAKNTTDLLEAYKTITNLVRTNKDSVYIPTRVSSVKPPNKLKGIKKKELKNAKDKN